MASERSEPLLHGLLQPLRAELLCFSSVFPAFSSAVAEQRGVLQTPQILLVVEALTSSLVGLASPSEVELSRELLLSLLQLQSSLQALYLGQRVFFLEETLR